MVQKMSFDNMNLCDLEKKSQRSYINLALIYISILFIDIVYVPIMMHQPSAGFQNLTFQYSFRMHLHAWEGQFDLYLEISKINLESSQTNLKVSSS